MLNFIIGVILLIIFVPFLIAGFSGAPWVPMRKRDIERVNKLADLKPGQKFIELGSGDGRVCHYIAKNNPGVDVQGVEFSWFMVLLSQIRKALFPVRNLKIILGNAFKTDLSDADVIFFYFLPYSMEKQLQKKLINEMKKGSKAISYVFVFNTWPGEHSVDKSFENPYPINTYSN